MDTLLRILTLGLAALAITVGVWLVMAGIAYGITWLLRRID